MIEHAWVPVSSHLAGVIIPNKHSEALPLAERDAVVFEKAMDTLNSYLDGKMWDGHPIISKKVACITKWHSDQCDRAITHREAVFL